MANRIGYGKLKPPPGAQLNGGISLARGLIGYWLFNENGGTVANDISGRYNNGTLTATPIWKTNSFGPGILFNGSNNYVLTPIKVSQVPATGSFSFWAYPLRAFNSGTREFLFGASDAVSQEIDFQHFTDNNLYVGWKGISDTRVVVAASATNWVANTWQMYTLTWVTGGTSTLYRNGVSIGTHGSTDTGYTVAGLNLIEIGSASNFNTNAFSGLIDGVRIYNRVLSQQEILQLYQEPFAGLLAPRRRNIVQQVSTTNTNGNFFLVF